MSIIEENNKKMRGKMLLYDYSTNDLATNNMKRQILTN